jgi:hypothetical protein
LVLVAEPNAHFPARTLTVRVTVKIVTGATGDAVAAARGRALRALLAALPVPAGRTHAEHRSGDPHTRIESLETVLP